MNRARVIVTWAGFLATFLWLAIPDLPHSPAVLWPSVLAVGLAFVTRDIYLSLFLGALAGATLAAHGNVFGAFLNLFARYLIPALQDPWNVSVLIFTLMMGGFVEVLNRNGGMTALAEWLLGRAHSRRRAAMGVYVLGWVVFFDGLANSMLVGKAMRPMTDRAGLSREKLSFIVDSTSSPIAGLALISTWVAYEMSVIRQGFENIGDPQVLAGLAPYQVLVQSLPFRFYNWFMLLIVFATIWWSRDLGPMLRAERRSAPSPSPHPAADSIPEDDHSSAAPSNRPSHRRMGLALVPLLALIGGVFAGLYWEGGGWGKPWTVANVVDALGQANAALVFVWATAFASILALLLTYLFPGDDRRERVVPVFFEGMKQMFLPTLILVFAWTLNGVIKELKTAEYLVSFLGDTLPAVWLPALVFILASLVSFSTGTSWGTMALVMPLVIPLAAAMSEPADLTGGPVMLATVGAVLAGAVFGDHCSPISDTTIVSAFSCDCAVMDHVRTQMPYALLAAGLAVVFGYAPAGWQIKPLWLLAVGLVASVAVIRYAGRKSSNP